MKASTDSEISKEHKEKHEMLRTYIESIMKITKEKEKQLMQNPYEKYSEDSALLEAKEVYHVNKELQLFLKEKLKKIS